MINREDDIESFCSEQDAYDEHTIFVLKDIDNDVNEVHVINSAQ